MQTTSDPSPLEQPWAAPAERVVQALEVVASEGLGAQEVRRRRARYGANRLRQAPRKSALRILGEQFASMMMILLGAAAALAFATGHLVDGVAILVVIALNAVIGFVVELRGTRSMEALHRLVEVNARVRRAGSVVQIRADELVPGDIVVLEGGDVVSADLRVIDAANLQADESTLTGESVPVDKSTDPVAARAPVAERSGVLHSGTALTRGSGEGVVVATGLATELGKVSSLVAQTEGEATPLERRLEALGRRLIWVTLALTALLALVGVALGRDLALMLQIAVALAVAAVPEGLPVVATIALARGMWRMARQNVLVSRLSAVETLGATGVICTDKTGTLTENRMTVTRIVLGSGDEVALGSGDEDSSGEAQRRARAQAGDGRAAADASDTVRNVVLQRAFEAAVLCNNASLDEGDAATGTGDPLEVALLHAARTAGVTREHLVEELPQERAEAFDAATRMMATFHRRGEGFLEVVKGAPEQVLAVCSQVDAGEGVQPMSAKLREHWLAHNARLAEEGLRVLALARRVVESVDVDPYRELVLVALVGLVDPPRRDVAAAIDECRRAGIRVVMVTGDQPATARHVAEQLHLTDRGEIGVVHGHDLEASGELGADVRRALLGATIVARVDPAQKLDLIALHQESGMVVAMTGDGVNDAPALKKADIGVAMGRRGTQVAREAADMVLLDDAFASIVFAVRQGRVIFDNIRKFVVYLISCNVAEIMVVTLATLANAPLPLLPLQILFLNLVTDVFPALALGVGPGDPRVMSRPPRPAGEAILTRAHWLAIAGYGGLITAAVLGAFGVAHLQFELPVAQAVTVSFVTLAFAQLWHTLNMRDRDASLLVNDITRNAYVWGALLLCGALIVLAVHMPALSQVLRLESPGARGWALALGASLAPLALGQLAKLFASARERRRNAGRRRLRRAS